MFRAGRTVVLALPLGALAVDVARALQARGALVLVDDRFEVPPHAESFYRDVMGVDIQELRGSRRQFARVCFDWTERVHHVAGALGAELLRRFLALEWLERVHHSRALRVTPAGRRGFREALGIGAITSRCREHTSHGNGVVGE